MRIVILARKNLQYNTRVERQAKALVQAGHEVRIVTLQIGGLPSVEHKDGYEIIRLKLDPLHQRIPRWIMKLMGALIRGIAVVERLIFRFLKGIFLLFGTATGFVFIAPLNIHRKLFHRHRSTNTPGESTSPSSGAVSDDPHALPHQEEEASASRMVLVDKLQFTDANELTLSKQILRRCKQYPLKLVRGVIGLVTKIVRLLLRSLAQPLTTLDFTLKAYKLLKNYPAHAFQAHDSQPLLATYLLSKRHRARFVYDAVEIVTDRSGKQWGRLGTWVGQRVVARLWEGFFIRWTDLVLTPTPVIAETLRKRYNVTARLIMNCTWFKRAEELRPPDGKGLRDLLNRPDAKILFYSGAISAPNGIDYLIRCMRYLPQELILVLMGPVQPKYEEQCKKLIITEKVQNRVMILPPVPPNQVSCYAASADVGIVAYQADSLNNYATLPNKFFEYIMARIPIAAPDFPALRQIITEEDIGRLYEPSNIEDMARAVREILEPKTYKRLKANLERAARKYSWEKQADKLVQLYESLLLQGTK